MNPLEERTQEHLELIALKRKWTHGRWMKPDSKVSSAAMRQAKATFVDGALSR